MASNINPTNIDITYPIAGQDNDTQGFRDNFSNIKNNFVVAKSEISAIQSTLDVSPTWTSVPTTATDTGVAGQIARDNTHLYVCIAENSWIRASFAAW